MPFISPDVIHHFSAGTQPVLTPCYYNSCEVNAAGILQFALLLLCYAGTHYSSSGVLDSLQREEMCPIVPAM